MQRKKWLLRTGLALLIFIMVVAAKFMDKTHPISELYVFGDSLSDTGMVFRATGGMYPPNPTYFQGRYSNGRVWIEYLGESLHLSSKQTHNFAYGGATTGNVGNSYVPSLLNQVQTFTQTHQHTNPDALYVLWAGANDYLQGVSSATIPVKNVTTAINSLTDVGAKKILVANLPDLGQLPATRNSANSGNLSALTQAHNQGLRRSLKVLSQQHSDLEIVQLDANALYRDAIANPTAFNFTNVISSCLSGSNTCGKPDQFLFWDGIHPTAAAHRIIGETAFSTIQEAGIINPRSMLVP
ncbi:GDSL family lipase [Nostoc commune NIES-4072]|uniref:GDSL family lipase n=1 Tax=Nostoc commune NIES-4072 TaxID=2005467 RepID=A0A2R5FN10_NOSCO|nr:SGNH/GDSL hydrolase family protein [Nostoc commune]BBD68859.1 GDSL family lipase [Nostoc commune HK-02]GBG20140.1 GDSL family lipase [Nostoc commune NIES-4072]